MNLYHIWQHVNNGWDTYDSAVVAAESEDAARLIRPDLDEWEGRDFYSAWTKTPEQVQVELIGEATPGRKAGLVIASFNAG